jgi:hypothetical protein
VKPDAVRGHLDALILAVREDGPRHGYAIIEALQARSGGRLDLPTGTVYPALRRLERAALLSGTAALMLGGVLVAVCSLVTITNFCIPSTMLAWLEGRRRKEAIA